MVKIDHFSTFPHGGAGTAARRLHERLIERGVSSRFNYWLDQNDQCLDDSYRQLVFQAPRPASLTRPVARQLERRRRRFVCRHYDRHVAGRPERHELFSIPWALSRSLFDFEKLSSDIVHLHWMAFFIDWPSFFQAVPDHIPLVWSFHDMNPLTGGCHYSDGCQRFVSGCGNCPQIADPAPRDVSWHALREKQRALRNKQLHIVTPNRWLAELAARSPVFPATTRYHLIRLGLDETVFRPIGRDQARRQLGLPPDRPLLAFGAEDIENHRKGFHHLLVALRLVRQQHPDLECLVFGNGQLPEKQRGLPRFHQYGYVDDPHRQRLIYSAADLFVLPSREDNQPQTGLESMACGTPVVAFEAGGIPEYVQHRQTGLIAPVGDETVMARQIGQLVDDAELRGRLAHQARQMILDRHTAERQARDYMDLYARLAAGPGIAVMDPAVAPLPAA